MVGMSMTVLMAVFSLVQDPTGSTDAKGRPKRLKVDVSIVGSLHDGPGILPIRVRITNVSTKPIPFKLDGQFPVGLKLEWLDPEGQKCRLISLAPTPFVKSVRTVTLGENEWLQGTVYRSLWFAVYETDTRGVAFRPPKQGRWQCWARIQDEEKEIASEGLVVASGFSGIPAEGEGMKSLESWHRFALGGRNIKVQEIAGLLNEERIGQGSLAAYLIAKRHDFVESTVPAAEFYEMALQLGAGNVSRSQCIMRLAYCKASNGNYDEALEWISKVDANEVDGVPADVESLEKLIRETKEKRSKP